MDLMKSYLFRFRRRLQVSLHFVFNDVLTRRRFTNTTLFCLTLKAEDKAKWTADHQHLRATFLDNTYQERYLGFLSKSFMKEVSPQLRKDSTVTTYRFVFPRIFFQNMFNVGLCSQGFH